jgi:hypothetical protein
MLEPMLRITLATLFAIATLTADEITLSTGPVESTSSGYSSGFPGLFVREYVGVTEYANQASLSLPELNLAGFTECQQYNQMGLGCSGFGTAEITLSGSGLGGYYVEEDVPYPGGFNTLTNFSGPFSLMPGIYLLTLELGDGIELASGDTPAPFTDSATASFSAFTFNGNVQIIVEPEPASVLLVLSGLIAVAMLRPLSRMRRRLSRFALALIK